MLLKPAPTPIRQFLYWPSEREFIGEISETNRLDHVYDDACDLGLTIVGATGREVVFVVWDDQHDGEGDLQFWTLRSTCGTYTLTLFND